MNTQHLQRAFTLVELVMVIVIIGLLATVVMPKFVDLKSEATVAAEDGAVSAIRSGIKMAYMANMAQGTDTYPTVLDSSTSGECSPENPLFTEVIDEGITDGNWQKYGSRTYRYLPSRNVYVYDRTTGRFTLRQ